MHLKMCRAGERNGSGVQSVSVQVVARVYTVQAFGRWNIVVHSSFVFVAERLLVVNILYAGGAPVTLLHRRIALPYRQHTGI